MVVLEDAEKLLESQECQVKVERDTLLQKYGIPINHLEFTYVNKCKDGKELERILQILRSGEEGYYPDLTKATESRLAVVKPKSKLLRKACPVIKTEHLNPEEKNEITSDLQKWITQASENDDTLKRHKNRRQEKYDGSTNNIRKCHDKITDEENEQKNSIRRIASTDYSSWDKYDPDTEILKMDLEEEKQFKKYVKNEKKKAPTKKTVQFKGFETHIEASHQASEERNKGNEFFRGGNFEEALHHYNASISCKPTVECFANRALVHLKLQKYVEAMGDCNSALNMEPNFVKALVRKAQALDGLGRKPEALECVEQAIRLDPNDKFTQKLAHKLRPQCSNVSSLKSTRFLIEEIDNGNKSRKQNKDNNKIVIPIPGTSKMSPPYYLECPKSVPENVRNQTLRANTPSQIVHLVSVDGSDDDSCTIDHLKRIADKKKGKCIDNNRGKGDHAKSETQHSSENLQNMEQGNTNGRKARFHFTNRHSLLPPTNSEAGGEPCRKSKADEQLPDDINSPYSFLKTWNSAKAEYLDDAALILRSIDCNRIVDIIGCKLDSAMFSKLLKCLSTHFTVPGEVNRLYTILYNISRLPRFDILAMLASKEDKKHIVTLVNFLKQHEKCLPQNIVNKFYI